jgi:hypothetical protein
MNFTYEFTVHDDEVVARPTEDGESPVTLDPEIAEVDGVTARWEPLVEDIVSEHREAFEGGRVTVPFDEAVEAIVAGDGDIQSQERARATLEYLVSEGVLDADGDQLVVLIPLEQVQEGRWGYSYNWAATLNGLKTRLESAIEAADKRSNTSRTHGEQPKEGVLLGQVMTDLEVIGNVMNVREQTIRSRTTARHSFPNDVVELTDNLSAVDSVVDGAESIDDDVKEGCEEIIDSADDLCDAVVGVDAFDANIDPDEIQAIATNFIDASEQVQPQSQSTSQDQSEPQ